MLDEILDQLEDANEFNKPRLAELKQARKELAALREQVKQMRSLKLLKVYAGFAENWEGFANDYPVGNGVTVGDLRAAAAALAALEPTQKGG